MSAALQDAPGRPLDAALHYAELGLRSFPVVRGTKRPRITDWPTRATTDPDQLRSWWQSWPDDNVGIALGQLDDGRHIFVLDVDEHDPAQSGNEALADLEASYAPLPETPTVLTPTGGQHIYLASPREVRNGRLAPGIDVRGAGGFVVAPPSIHPDGGRYEWQVP